MQKDKRLPYKINIFASSIISMNRSMLAVSVDFVSVSVDFSQLSTGRNAAPQKEHGNFEWDWGKR